MSGSGEEQLAKKTWVTEDFDFDLPDHLIAQRPSHTRGKSRLMFLPASGAPVFQAFEEMVSLFRGDEVLVLNDTRVVPARLHGEKETGGRVEVFFLERGEGDEILAMTRGRLKLKQEISLPLGATATLLERDEHGRARLRLKLAASDRSGDPLERERALWAWLEEAGRLPLPPYIQRDPDDDDYERYQTVFARSPGAVAAPTAGLHFTDEILEQLRAKGVSITYVTLHVGPGTFLPVKASSLKEHVMHSERFSVPRATQELLRSGRPIIAVGTTVVRALESFCEKADTSPEIWGQELEQNTDIFITPRYSWRAVDGLLTNFHLPQSTLLMLVSAFVGYERAMSAYQEAIKEELQFYSYGDASMLVRPDGRWHPRGFNE